jgi:hypothetical protein
MASRHSGYARDQHDFYVEPSWCAFDLFNRVFFDGTIHDPCCGLGTIVDTAISMGIPATGSDIVDRANGRFPTVDFLKDERIYENIVCNPPYRRAESVLAHAIDHVGPSASGIVAAIVPIQFLASQRRAKLFTSGACDEVLIHSRRPSMPPGELIVSVGEAARHSGSTDYVWVVFRPKRNACCPAEIKWLG